MWREYLSCRVIYPWTRGYMTVTKRRKGSFREHYLSSKWPYMPGSQFLTYSVPINLAPGLPSPSLPWFFPFTLTLTSHSPFLLFPLSEESIRPGDQKWGRNEWTQLFQVATPYTWNPPILKDRHMFHRHLFERAGLVRLEEIVSNNVKIQEVATLWR